MSHQAVTAAVLTPAPSNACKLVMLILAHHHNAITGRCFPSMRRVAIGTGLDPTSVKRAMKLLVEAKLIERKVSKKPGTADFHRSSYRYDLLFMRNVPEQAMLDLGEGVAPDGEGMAPPKQEANHPSAPLRSAEGNAPAAKKPRRKALPRGTRIKPDWKPTADQISYAVSTDRPGKPIAPEEVPRMAADFRDHWLQSSLRSAIKVDWNAAWQLWCRRQHDERKTPDGTGQSNRTTGAGGRSGQQRDRIGSAVDAATKAGDILRSRRDAGGSGLQGNRGQRDAEE